MKEIWKSIEGYEDYEISNFGRVKSLKYGKEKILKQTLILGYFCVSLCKNGKDKIVKVHRLVAQAFVPNPNNYPCVNHKNENTIDNRPENLEWCTHEYNLNYGTRNERISKSRINNPKISKPIRCIETGIIYPSIKEAQRKLGFDNSGISACLHKRQKTCGGFHWESI